MNTLSASSLPLKSTCSLLLNAKSCILVGCNCQILTLRCSSSALSQIFFLSGNILLIDSEHLKLEINSDLAQVYLCTLIKKRLAKKTV